MRLFNIRKYNVFYLEASNLKPFTKTRGPVSFENISYSNMEGLRANFPVGKIDVFKKKLDHGCKGLFAKYKDEVVGYMWRKDYNSKRTIKADGYLPIKGKFSHIHFARVHRKMRGRALQLILITKLILDAKSTGYSNIYTDTDIKNPIASRGIIKLGFTNTHRLLVVRFRTGHSFTMKYKTPRKSIEKLQRNTEDQNSLKSFGSKI